MPEKKVYVFIDESGTLPDPDNQKIVLVAVAASNNLVFKKALLKLKDNQVIRKGIGGREFKFYTAGNRGRLLYLQALAKEHLSVFALTIDKGSQRITDSPANYAVLSWILLLDCLAYFQNENIEIIFDKHFHRSIDEKKFFGILRSLIGRDVKAESADSLTDPGLTAADFVAGSFLYAKSGKSLEFYEAVRSRIVSEKEINWKEAKRNFIEATKNLPEPVQAPIQGKSFTRSQVQVPGIG